MSPSNYEITVPGFIGMQTFVQENDSLRALMARLPGGYVELPMAQRVFLSATGQRIQHAVFIYRITADQKQSLEINAMLRNLFYGKAPYSVTRNILSETARLDPPEQTNSTDMPQISAP